MTFIEVYVDYHSSVLSELSEAFNDLPGDESKFLIVSQWGTGTDQKALACVLEGFTYDVSGIKQLKKVVRYSFREK